MSEFSRFRNIDSFQCNVCHHFDRFNCACSEEPYCIMEVEKAYQQGRADAIDELMKTMESWGNNIMEIRGTAPFFTLDNIRDIAEQLKEQTIK